MAGFKIDLDLGPGSVVEIRLSEEAIRKHPNPMIRGMADSNLGSAAVELVRRAITRNLAEPIEVATDKGLYIIPTGSVRYAFFHDPTMASTGQPMGFREPTRH
jgi:hypothetical protein